MKILVIEDEPELREAIEISLKRENYRVETASDLESALIKIGSYRYDCILLDIMLPGGSGLKILDELKAQEIPGNVIIISAKDSLDDKIRGLELGADDYLAKPFHISELSARLKAVLRRKLSGGKTNLEAGNLCLDPANRTLQVAGRDVTLNRKEFDVLHYLILNQDRLVTRTALAEHVWGDHIDQADNFDFIYYQIKNLRRKLTDSGARVELQAVYGVGYKLTAT
ncbi:MAG: response regulator transcription factor [Solitalea sp.]